MTELPLFPLHSVLCPGIALPLHIFEERYRLMVGRCLEGGDPFGVVLIREGHEVGALRGHVAAVGTTAVIRQAGRYPDGRLDIVTIGQRRFRIEQIETSREPYLVGQVSMLDEPMGCVPQGAERLARHLGQRFLRYLELLRPGDDNAATRGDPVAEVDLASGTDLLDEPGEAGDDRHSDHQLDDRQRAELLAASARSLVQRGDATAVSYLLTGLVQVDMATRQELLETPHTLARLERLDSLLSREIELLLRHLRPLAVDPRLVELHRN